MLELAYPEENKLFCENCDAVRNAFVAAQPVAGVSNFIIIRVIKARAVILRSQLLFFGSVKEIIEGTVESSSPEYKSLHGMAFLVGLF